MGVLKTVAIILGVLILFRILVWVIPTSGIATYLEMQHAHKNVLISWKSKGELTHYDNVTVSGNVSVAIPVVTLSMGLNKNGTIFSSALRNDIEGILRANGLTPEFIGEEMNFSIPKVVKASGHRLEGPVLFVFIPFYGYENHWLNRECYASVIVYMNSNPDSKPYLSMIGMKGGTKYLATWLFERAQSDGTAPYSMGVVYWDTLTVKVSNDVKENCWAILAGEVANGTKGWVRTLSPHR